MITAETIAERIDEARDFVRVGLMALPALQEGHETHAIQRALDQSIELLDAAEHDLDELKP